MGEQADELRHLVNDGKYEQSLQFFRSLPQNQPEGLRKLAIDTIFDAVSKYRDNNDGDLRALVVSLFDAIHPELLKFRICFNFITSRSTPHLNEVLINQLGLLITDEFKERHPCEWEEMRVELPLKLESNLPPEDDVDVLQPSAEVAGILYSLKEVPFTIPPRMSAVFARAVHTTEPKLPDAFPLLVFYSRSHPFSPKLLEVTSPTVLIPSIYRRQFLGRKLAEGLIAYLEEVEYNYERHYVKPVVTALNAIVKCLEDLDVSDIDLCCNLILPLLRFVEDFDQRSFRVPIMDKCHEIIQLFGSSAKCLLLKHILPRILDNDDLCLENESTIVAWIVDQFRRHLDEEPFRKELGSFLGLLEDVRYNDMLHASNYYSSIFCLVQTVAIKRLNLAMLREVETRLIDRIHAQLKDYIQLEEMRRKKAEQKKDKAPALPEGIQFEVAAPAPEGSVVDQLQLLMFGCEQSRRFIAEALSACSNGA